MSTDKRRYGIIMVRQLNARTFHLTINQQVWSEVEWSPERGAWCVQDAAGHCLAHCEHIVGTNVDQRTAIALAKAMILDGRMPTPEEAQQQLREAERQSRKRVTPPAPAPLPLPLPLPPLAPLADLVAVNRPNQKGNRRRLKHLSSSPQECQCAQCMGVATNHGELEDWID